MTLVLCGYIFICIYTQREEDSPCMFTVQVAQETKLQVGETQGKSAHSLFGSPGRESIKSVTQGKPLHIHCSGLPRDSFELDEYYLKNTEETSALFIVQVSCETEFLKLIVLALQ